MPAGLQINNTFGSLQLDNTVTLFSMRERIVIPPGTSGWQRPAGAWDVMEYYVRTGGLVLDTELQYAPLLAIHCPVGGARHRVSNIGTGTLTYSLIASDAAVAAGMTLVLFDRQPPPPNPSKSGLEICREDNPSEVIFASDTPVAKPVAFFNGSPISLPGRALGVVPSSAEVSEEYDFVSIDDSDPVQWLYQERQDWWQTVFTAGVGSVSSSLVRHGTFRNVWGAPMQPDVENWRAGGAPQALVLDLTNII